MKTMKKLSALVLALMMVLSVAVSSAAAEDEEIMPRYRMGYCPNCHAMVEVRTQYKASMTTMVDSYPSCNVSSTVHVHEFHYDYDVFQCAACNYPSVRIATHILCVPRNVWLS